MSERDHARDPAEEARWPAGAAEPRAPAGAPRGDEQPPSDEPSPAEAAGVGGPEDPEAAEPEATPAEPEEASELAEARRERDEYLELAQRTRAELENYRRRAARDAEAAERRGRATLARELIPALDNVERALQAAGIDPEGVGGEGEPAASSQGGGESGDGSEAHADQALAHGVALTYRELRGTLERAGVEPYDPAGERFDPTWHEAVSTRPEAGTEAGVVLETLERGYRLDGQVLRAARVIVSS